MKVIIAGGRDIEDYDVLLEAVNESGFDITHVVSGGANGVDTMAIVWAKENEIPWTVYPAQWNKYRAMGRVKQAGHIRNSVMADNAEALIAIWDGVSSGTKNMIENAKQRDLPIYIQKVEPQLKKENRSSRKQLDPGLLD